MTNTHPTKALGPVICRLGDVMMHITRYSFDGSARLAEDAQVTRSSISRILSGKMNPSFVMVARITGAIEEQLGFQIDPRDLISEAGAFRTPYVCEALHCGNCLPDIAHDDSDRLSPQYKAILPGKWVTSESPKGFDHEGGPHAK